MTQRLELQRAGRWMSWALRHAPAEAGLQPDAKGWVLCDDLCVRIASQFRVRKSDVDLHAVVQSDAKQRFEISSDGRRIRAAQGHSFPVDLSDLQQSPPAVLYHGTATRLLPLIRQQGLLPGRRQYVHLSEDARTAAAVGARHGAPVVLPVRCDVPDAALGPFIRASNGVWLVASVPPSAITWDQLTYPDYPDVLAGHVQDDS